MTEMILTLTDGLIELHLVGWDQHLDSAVGVLCDKG